jgi:hypothetical protein
MSPFEVVQAIQSAGVGVVGLDSRRTVVVFRSVDDQDVGETAVIRFRCVPPANRKIRRVTRGESDSICGFIISGQDKWSVRAMDI